MASPRNKVLSRNTSYTYLVSSCLAGIDCTFNKESKLNLRVRRLVESGAAIPVCPEVMGGASVPRNPCEIVSGDGYDVLDKRSRVMTICGKDVTDIIVRGSRKVLNIIRKYGIRNAIMKSKSPSCGSGMIYNGTFTSTLVKGDGVTVALLRRNNVRIYDEKRPELWPVKSITRR